MVRKYIFLPYLALGLLFPVSLGSAETHDDSNCGARATVLDYLSAKYSEKPIAMGIAANGGLIEVLTSNDGTTFTIIVTMPEGETCMVATGEGWESLTLAARRQPNI
jgi:hypothetical protein